MSLLNSFTHHLRSYLNNKTINYALMILVALLGVVIPTWFYQAHVWITPLILGVIAAALAEQDDGLIGRFKAISFTLPCFAIATYSIEILFDYPVYFAIGLFISTFGFTMLGAIGSRYASISFGSLLIAIYTMIGANQNGSDWLQPILLLTGAIWYFIVSTIWAVVAPRQPMRHSLSLVFENIANYLDLKAELFHPSDDFSPQPYRIKEANLNATTVIALNNCKTTFLTRSKRGNIHTSQNRFLNIYFLAQDIHERVSSTHYRYQDLAAQFERSDVLFRFKYVIESLASSCRDVSKSIKLDHAYQHDANVTKALTELQRSLDHLKQQSNPEWHSLLNQLGYLFDNLATVAKQLDNISQPTIEALDERDLDDHNVHNLENMWRRVKSNLTRESLLFRHAIRMSVALTAGYGVIQGLDLSLGYWILLTTLFVCQPNYAATKQRITLRIIGTISGLIIGSVLLSLFPSQESQVTFIVVSGVLFFSFRINNYAFATGFITILVLFCFSQLGAGFNIIIPRLFDTVIGCVLAVLAVAFILPDWHARRLHIVMAEAIEKNRVYLAQIIGQYRIGKKDSLSYRIARREAHNQDAALTAAINNMLAEPGRYHTATDESFRFLTLNHALLSYISALGAHRDRLEDESVHKLILDSHRVIHQHLALVHQQLQQQSPTCDTREIDSKGLQQRLASWRDDDDSSAKLVLQQLHLIYQALPELHSLASKLAARTR
ncbi:YccS family putative transporter [Vibrio sp. WJH972]